MFKITCHKMCGNGSCPQGVGLVTQFDIPEGIGYLWKGECGKAIYLGEFFFVLGSVLLVCEGACPLKAEKQAVRL